MKAQQKVLFDTNILMDSLTNRQPFADATNLLVNMAENGEIQGVLCATTITTLYYLIKKYVDKATADEKIGVMLKIFDIAPVDKNILQNAQRMQAKDFEDAVIIASAEQYQRKGVDASITRNIKDFKSANVPVYTPAEAVIWLKNLGN